LVSLLIDRFKDAAPAYFVEKILAGVDAHYRNNGFADDVVLGNISPKSRVEGIMAVVAHHPVIIHFKGITVCLFTVDQDRIA
jgi:hypothetical protein